MVCSKTGLTAEGCTGIGREVIMESKVKKGRGWAVTSFRGQAMKYESQTSESKASDTISFWVHFEEGNSDSLLPSNVVVPKLVPVDAA